ncbi:MAG TPA: class I SAM-dependent methyltransferase [Candidatus Limnocylindrales bacterium]|nr:class I SAM-dependent methyltransferase [Candidatus Limnocylindrales bacterium]
MSGTAITPQSSFDHARQDAFVGKIMSDTSAAMTTVLASIGDRLGLFKDLSENGAATSSDLARRTGIQERYAREWLGGMATAGYVEYDPLSGQFRLPPEHAAALAQEGGPFFFGGIYQMLPPMVGVMDQLVEAFRGGGGVPQSAYAPSFWDGLERFTAGWFENLLLQQWIPAMPDVEVKLRRGATVADIGCGRGRALIKLAQAFPASTYVGFDVFAPAIEQARERAAEAGVADRVQFRQMDAAKGLPERYDVISTFDVVHDAVDPLGLLRAIHAALQPDGRYICLDINCSEKLEGNAGPLGAMFHGVSILYCMTTSLSGGGAGLGTLGFHERKATEMCTAAGFSSIRRLPLENPFNNIYEVKP